MSPDSTSAPDFRARLREELARRRQVNRRYSVRAFAELLGVDHSTLSQVLRGVRPVSPKHVRAWAARLGMGREETELYTAATKLGDLAVLMASVRHAQWMAEASAFMSNAAHWRLLELLHSPDWRPDMRWASRRLGIEIDRVHEAIARLLRLRLLRIEGDTWQDLSGLQAPRAANLIELALARLRALNSAA